jgi:hypothetical protein
MSASTVLPWFALAGTLLVLSVSWRLVVASRRRQFIRHYRFPPAVFDGLRDCPELDAAQRSLVAQALRQFFLAYLLGGRKPVAMPSKVVDALWHAFILHTRAYDDFCRQAFGRFLHHTPSAAMGRSTNSNAGLRRVWWHACRAENLDPRAPKRIPLLFAIDRKLGVPGGHHYHLPTMAAAAAATNADGYSVEIFSDTSVDGTTDGFPAGGDGGDGDGGGCGGD